MNNITSTVARTPARLAEATVALSPEEVDIIIESLRSWGASNWRALDKAFATEAYELHDRLVAERRERRHQADLWRATGNSTMRHAA